MLKVSDLTTVDCEQDDQIVIRVFINGQYMTSARIIDKPFRDTTRGNTLVFDADLELFEMEKK